MNTNKSQYHAKQKKILNHRFKITVMFLCQRNTCFLSQTHAQDR